MAKIAMKGKEHVLCKKKDKFDRMRNFADDIEEEIKISQ